MVKLGIVIPCYNEEAVVADTAAEVLGILGDLVQREVISADSFVLFVNDGSTDSTWQLITGLHSQDSRVKGLNLLSNVGQQNAIMAGMMTVRERVDAVVTIDADLQDDITCLEQMLGYYREGCDVVYGVRESREVNGYFKRTTARMFYRLQRALGVKNVDNHADFRLMSRRALDELAQYKERVLYLRGIVPLLGLRSARVSYRFRERKAGKSKYTLGKMLNLGVDGITGFSATPINYIIGTGCLFLVVSFFMMLYILWSFFVGRAVSGWTSIMLSMWFIGAMILLSIGVIGKYIANIFAEVKRRPLYHIDTFLD
ncbi:MAG: glycosyltransferase family 2 protein [Muribaculaceae bacterium]